MTALARPMPPPFPKPAFEVTDDFIYAVTVDDAATVTLNRYTLEGEPTDGFTPIVLYRESKDAGPVAPHNPYEGLY